MTHGRTTARCRSVRRPARGGNRRLRSSSSERVEGGELGRRTRGSALAGCFAVASIEAIVLDSHTGTAAGPCRPRPPVQNRNSTIHSGGRQSLAILQGLLQAGFERTWKMLLIWIGHTVYPISTAVSPRAAGVVVTSAVVRHRIDGCGSDPACGESGQLRARNRHPLICQPRSIPSWSIPSGIPRGIPVVHSSRIASAPSSSSNRFFNGNPPP
jgi:hypothetical protein